MKRIFQTIALLAVMMVMSAPAWSHTYSDHVSVANNGEGDLIFFPTYFAFEGFQTKLQVINTRDDMSAVVKLVVRTPQYSQEILDFFIFLSPTDVWEGYLKWEDGEPVIYSEDDSSLVSSAPTFASAENPMQKALTEKCEEVNIYGYVEGFLTWVFPEDDDATNLTAAPVEKEDIYNAYVGSGSGVANPKPTAGYAPKRADDLDFETNILAANQQIQSPLLGWSSALRAIILKDYLATTEYTTLEETIIGTEARNNLQEVEAAMAKNNVGMPYIYNEEGNSFHFFNFPTKLTRLDDECRITNWLSDYEGFEGSDFNESTDTWGSVKVRYTASLYDQEENEQKGTTPIFSPAPVDVDHFPFELDFFSPAVEGFEKGWVKYELPNGPTSGVNLANEPLRYYGAPVIPFVMNFGDGGFSTMNSFYSERDVKGSDDGGVTWYNLPGYQYARVTPGT